MLDRPLDQALLRCQVHDVELVDPRRAEQQRNRMHPLALRCVLDQLDQLASVDDRPRGGRHVHADLEAGRVHLRGPAPVEADVTQQVAHAPQHALATRVESLTQSRGIARERVGGCERVHQELRCEPCLCVLVGCQPGCVEQVVDQPVGQQVLLGQQVVQRVLDVRQVIEAPVTLGGRHRTGAVAADTPAGRRPSCRRQPDEHAAVRRCSRPRVLGQCCRHCSERPQERHRIGAHEGVLDDTEPIEDGARSAPICCIHVLASPVTCPGRR